MEAGSGKEACSSNEEKGQISVTAALENNKTNREDIRTSIGKDIGARNVPAFRSDAQSRQPESRGRNTAHIVALGDVSDVAAIPGNARLGVGLLPEILKSGCFEIFQQRLVGRLE
jgi:hypothetical protein